MKKIGFLGLGNIGKGICNNLIRKGHTLTVYDVNAKAMEAFKGKATLAANPVDVLKASDYIFFSLPNSTVIESIMDQFFAAGIKGKTIIDTSTSYPLSTKRLYEKVKAAGGVLVDAPLMAGPDEAEKGILDIVVGGDKKDYDNLKELFDAYCRDAKYVGEIGNGHLAKLAINFCGLTEALLFAQIYPVMEKLGFSREALFGILNNEALANWVFDFYSKKYVDRNYRLDFALSLGLKDLSYMKRLYEELNIPGFILDGALDLCRVTLAEQKDGETLDFSHPCRKMDRFVGNKE